MGACKIVETSPALGKHRIGWQKRLPSAGDGLTKNLAARLD
jgi:hypothetical protein